MLCIGNSAIKMKRPKLYVFIFEDRNENDLQKKEAQCYSLKEAKALAKTYKNNSMLNDLYKIVVKSKC